MDPLLRDVIDGPGLRVDDGRPWSRDELLALAGGMARALRGAARVDVPVGAGARSVAMLLAARAVGAVACPVAGDGVPDAAPAELTVDPGDAIAWGVATSGTTGTPRTVALTAGGVEHVTTAITAIVPYDADDHVLCPLPLHHTYGLSQLWLCARTGATLVLPPAPVLPGDLARLARDATVLAAVPSTARALLLAGVPASLRLVTLAGQETPLRLRHELAASMPATRFVSFYGLTEATTRVLWLPPERFGEAGTGFPIPGVRVQLHDGELVVEGPNVAPGYLDGPRIASQLRTGDLFSEENGLYTWLGRKDGVLKRHGEKVIPERVEAAMLAIPGVTAALVLPEPEDGLLARVEGTASDAAILRALRGALPPVMIPSRFERVDTLPTTTSGKLRRT